MSAPTTASSARSTDDTERTIIELFHGLQQDELVVNDWAETLSATPSVIVIMGESMVVASVPSAAQVQIKESNLS
jgi:hypothetical protein